MGGRSASRSGGRQRSSWGSTSGKKGEEVRAGLAVNSPERRVLMVGGDEVGRAHIGEGPRCARGCAQGLVERRRLYSQT